MTTFIYQQLPDVDQQIINKGRCPWCLSHLYDGFLIDGSASDFCVECDDKFTYKEKHNKSQAMEDES